MRKFEGFPPGKVRHTAIPAPFFTELLPAIDHLGELKLTLYVFWRLDRMEGNFRYLWKNDFLADERLMEALAASGQPADEVLEEALQRATARGSLLAVKVQVKGKQDTAYFLNTERGRTAVLAIQRGHWQPTREPQPGSELAPEPPNIYQLYEAHIGPLTPLIAETLLEAEETYPPTWVEEAFRIAVENNVRRWRYIEAILRSWQEEGRDERGVRGDSEKDRRRYVRGKFSEYVEH